MLFCKFETKSIPQRNLPQRPVVIDWKDITSDFHSDLMHISAGKLDGADLRPRELWTMNEFKIFQDDQFCPNRGPWSRSAS